MSAPYAAGGRPSRGSRRVAERPGGDEPRISAPAEPRRACQSRPLSLRRLVSAWRQEPGAALAFELGALILQPVLVRLFEPQLAVALEPGGGESAALATASTTAQPGSDSWRAIAEAAVRRELGDVAKRGAGALAGFPQLHLAHARRIDEDAVAGQHDQLPARAGVPARLSEMRTSRVASRSWPTSRLTMVDFPTPDDPSSAPVRPDPERTSRRRSSETGSLQDTAWTATSGGDAPHLVDERRRIVHQVRLVQHDDRRGAAVRSDEEVALDAARVVVAVEPGDEKDDVDVGGDDLLLGAVARGPA